MNKKELRKLYREKRSALRPLEKDKLEDLLLIMLQKLDIEIPAKIMTYAPFENEYDPELITDYCNFKNPAQQLIYPVVDTINDKMNALMVDEHTAFSYSKFGVAEPVDRSPILPGEIDMLIVPLLAFDKNGYRVGYGKGYYDKFLKACRNDAIKIGFSFFEPEHSIDDINMYDVKLDHCITPITIYNF